MTNKRLVWYLEKKKKIDDRQFGFRKKDTIRKGTLPEKNYIHTAEMTAMKEIKKKRI